MARHITSAAESRLREQSRSVREVLRDADIRRSLSVSRMADGYVITLFDTAIPGKSYAHHGPMSAKQAGIALELISDVVMQRAIDRMDAEDTRVQAESS